MESTGQSPIVLIIMGSDSDLSVMSETAQTLKDLSIPFRITVASAHRTPERVKNLIKEAEDTGIDVIIAGAGAAAHLAGAVAAHTTLPVIGVPLDSSPLSGLDALLSTVQMPAGVPVAAMAIGKAGAKNAAIFATQILAIKHPSIREQLKSYKSQMAESVIEKANKVESLYAIG
jgi:phosphoribosylaminoimidazole carboxylase PurE protein